jgi:hypothetical protein
MQNVLGKLVAVLKRYPPEEVLDMDNIMSRESLDVIGVPQLASSLCGSPWYSSCQGDAVVIASQNEPSIEPIGPRAMPNVEHVLLLLFCCYLLNRDWRSLMFLVYNKSLGALFG